MVETELADFLEQGLGMYMGTRNAELQPDGARVVAVKVEDDGVHLVAYVPEVAGPRILPNLESNGQAALVFARPSDERACQVKGVFVTARPASEDERPLVDAQWDGYLRQLEGIGIPREATAGWVTWPAIAVRLKVTAIFDQTPGPHAGTALS